MFRRDRGGAGEATGKGLALVGGRRDILSWVYLGRIALVSGILLAALLVWGQARADQTFLATVMFAVALGVTAAAAWYTHLLKREPGRTFLYGQVTFDVLLVTGVVHVTGGSASNFAWLYILVIAEGALLLPLPGGVLIGGLAAVLYAADIVWGHAESVTGAVALQVSLFAVVAILIGLLGDRVRRAGMALGAVESELRRLRVDTTEILTSIDTGVLTVDQDERLVYMNPAAEVILGMDARQWQEAPVVDAIGEVSPGLADHLRQAVREGTARSRHKALAQRDGARVILGIGMTVRDEDEGRRSVTAIFQDITDPERIESLNRRNERLEAVAELSAAMAHEIKNPLSSIRSAVEQFQRPSLAESDRGLLVRMVIRESERLSRLLSDFIDFSRVRLGHLRPVEMRRLVRDCANVVRRHPDAEGRNVKVDVVSSPGDEVWIPGDEDLLHRAVFNLLLNGVQFSPAGGTVRVEVEDLRNGSEGKAVGVDHPVRLRIRDQGPGISPEDAERIFDPFYTTRDGGSGLGLAVVHRAVEAHKGRILADSPGGGGAEFTLYLPGERTKTNGGAG
jgi:two-component system, NtrC family, sensor histidine kinase PilS